MTRRTHNSLVRRHRKSASRLQRLQQARKLFVEQLEDRRLLAADVFVNDDWNLVTDNGTLGVIDAGDIVDDSNDAGGPTGTFTLDDGTGTVGTAFGTVTTGSATGFVPGAETISAAIGAVDIAGTVNLLAGNYVQTGTLFVNKSVNFVGAGQDQSIIKGAGAATQHEQRIFEIQAENVTLEDLTIGGWVDPPTDANVGSGYLVWNEADHTTLNNVHFTGDDIRVAIYTGTSNYLTVTDSRFTGTYFRAGIRGAGEHMLISRNSFEESHYWYSPIYFEYGGATSGEISYNYFASRVGVNNTAQGVFKEDGTGIWAITNFQPDKITGDGLQIVHNSFHFQDSDLLNQTGNQPIPVGIYNDPAITAGGPITVQDNIFQGYEYTGAQPTDDPSWQPAARTAPYNGALAFDGSTTHGVFQTPLLDIGTKGTVAFWINPTDVGGQRHSLINGGGVEVTLRNGAIYFYPDSSESSSLTYAATGSFTANTWTHIAVSWDFNTQSTAIYINGTEAAYLNPYTPANSTWSTPADTVNKVMYVGRDPNNSDRFFPGQMDDIGFFDNALSPAEIASVMTSGVSSFLGDGRLIADWTLDQSSGDVAVDAKNSIDLNISTTGLLPSTFTTPTFLPAGGQIAGALEFDQTQEHYGTFQSPAYDVGSGGTLSLWIKPTDVGSQRHQILDGGGMGFTIRNKDAYFYTVSGNDNTLTYSNDDSLAADTWTHIAYTWDFATKTTHIYFDGVETTAYLGSFGTSHPAWTVPANTVDQLISLGIDFNNVDRRFPGLMDDIGIFNQALTPAEVANVKNNGVVAPGADPRLVTHWTLDNSPGTTEVPSDNGEDITLHLQQRPPLPGIEGLAINSSPGTTATNNLFYENDVNFNVSVTDAGNVNGNPVFKLSGDIPVPFYQIGFGSLAAYSSTEYQGDTETLSPHIGAFQGDPGLFGTGDLVVNGSDGDDLLELFMTGADSGTLTYTRDFGGPSEEIFTPVVLTNITGITFNGLMGDDLFIINNQAGPVFDPINGIIFDGGSGGEANGIGNPDGDKLELVGGTATTVEHELTTEGEGLVYYNGESTATISYTGLEPVDDSIDATNRIFTFTAGMETITLSDDVGNAGFSLIDSDVGSETISFANPTGVGANVLIRTEASGGSGVDTINLQGVDAAFDADLKVVAGTDDAVVFRVADTDIGGGDLDISAGSVLFDDGAFVTTGNATIAATNGSIDNTGGNLIDLTAADGVLSATAGIAPIGDDLFTALDRLEASDSSSDGIFIDELDGLTIGGISGFDGVSSAGGDIDIETLGAGTLVINEPVTSAGGFIDLVTFDGTIEINDLIDSDGGDIFILAGLGETTSDVDLDATILSGNGLIEIFADNDVLLSATAKIDSESGSSTTITDISMDDAQITVGADDDLDGGGGITMANGSVIDAWDGDIVLEAAEDITVSLLRSTSFVGVFSDSGAILDADGGTGLDIDDRSSGTARTTLFGSTGIGSLSDPIETRVSELQAGTDGGDIYADNTGDLTLVDVFAGLASPAGLSVDSLGGDVVITTTGSMTVSDDLQSFDGVDGNITLTAGGGLTIDDGVLVDAGTGDVDLNATDDVLLTGVFGDDVFVDSTSGSILDNGDTNKDVESNAVTLTANGTIGTMINAVDINVDTLTTDTTAAGGSQWIEEMDDVALLSLNAGTGSVFLEAMGNITDGGDDDKDIIAAGAWLKSMTGNVGENGGVDAIDTQVDNLEGWATGSFHVADMLTGLIIGGVTAHEGIYAGGDIVVSTTGGLLDVTEDVTTGEIGPSGGSITLTSTDDSSAGQDLIVRTTKTVSSSESFVLLQAGDDLTLEDSSTVSAFTTITLQGDYLDADTGVGTLISLFGTLDAAGTAGNITVEGDADNDVILVRPDPDLTGVAHTADGLSLEGQAGDDTYHIWNGRLNGGGSAVTVVEPGGAMENDDVVIVEGRNDVSPAGETFNIDGTSGGTVENLDPTLTKSEIVTYPLGVERLIVRGNLGNDIFTGSTGAVGVEPSLTTVITIDGGAPGFGDDYGPGGSPNDGPGDIMIFDPLDNVFQIIGKTIFTDGVDANFTVMDAGDFKGVNFRRIESLPLIPTAMTPTKRYDFDGPALATQTDYTSVAPVRLYGTGTTGSDFGWVTSAPGTFDRGNVLTTPFEDLLQDGHFLSTPKTFRADVLNGWHLVSVKMGDTSAHDQMRVTNADNGQVLLANVSNVGGQFPAPTFVVQVFDGTLDLTFSDLGGDPTWVLNALEIRPGEILTFGSPDPGELIADGFTEDTFLGFEATPGELITISASIDVTGDDIPDAPLVVTSMDMDPDLAGVQVLASATGTFSYSIQRPGARGTGFVKMEHVTGIQTGCLAIDYVAPFLRRFDFNSPTSPTQTPVASASLPTGYAGVLPTQLYRHTAGTRLLNNPGIDPVRGYGWTNNVGSFDRATLTPVTGSQAELRRDAHFLSTTQTFTAELSPGTYQVNVTLGDATASHDNIEIRANGVLVPGAINTPAGDWVQKTFIVSIGATGLLDLEFRDTGGEPNWVVNGIEMRETSMIGTHMLTPNGAGTTISGTGATPGALITVATTLGSIASADDNPSHAGVQVTATAGGTFSFDVTPPFLGGTATLTSYEVTGAADGSIMFTYAAATTGVRFDLNGSGSPTAAGFVGVGSGTANAYTALQGYGWQTTSGTFDRGGPTALLRDGHFGTDNTFLANLANGDYIVNVTMGDSAAVRDLVDVYAEGVLKLDNVTAPANQRIHRSFPVTVSDGQLNLRFDDDGGDQFFAVNAIEIIAAQALHSLSPDGPGTTISGSGATAGSLVTVSTTLGSIAPSTADANPNYAGVQVIASPSGTFSFTITQPAAAGTATIRSEEVTALGAGSTTFGYAGLGPVVQIIDDDGNGTAVPGFSAPTFNKVSAAGTYLGDTNHTIGDSTGDTATWTFSVVAGGTYRISATWKAHANRASNAPFTISGIDDSLLSGTVDGKFTVNINQRVLPSDQAYTRVQDPPSVGTWFADLGVGATYIADGSGTLTISLSDMANGYVIADGVRVERLSPLHAEAATLGGTSAASSVVLTAGAARGVVNQAIANWQAVDPRAASLLGNVEVIVSDLPQRVLGLASETSHTLWLDSNGAGHGWSFGAASSSAGMDLLTVVSHELGHLLGLDDLDPTAYAGNLMSARLNVGVGAAPGATGQSLTTLDVARPFAAQARAVDDLFSDLGRSGFFSALTDSTNGALTTDRSDRLLRTDADNDSALSDGLAVDQDRVVADRRLLSDLSRQRLEREELDELFAHTDELLETFEAKLLD